MFFFNFVWVSQFSPEYFRISRQPFNVLTIIILLVTPCASETPSLVFLTPFRKYFLITVLVSGLFKVSWRFEELDAYWHPSPECRWGFTLEWIPYSSKCNACSKPYVARQVSWHLEFSAGFHLVKMSKCHELTSMGIPKPMQQIFLALEHTYYRHPGDRLKALSLLSGVSLMLAYWSYREYMVTSISFVFISGHCFQGSF